MAAQASLCRRWAWSVTPPHFLIQEEQVDCAVDVADINVEPNLKARTASYQPSFSIADTGHHCHDRGYGDVAVPDEIRLTKELVRRVVVESEMQSKPFLLLCNKCDSEDALSITEVCQIVRKLASSMAALGTCSVAAR